MRSTPSSYKFSTSSCAVARSAQTFEVSLLRPSRLDTPQLGAGILDEKGGTASVAVETLRTGMVIVDEVLTTSGAVLLRAGERLTAEHLQRIQRFRTDGILLTTEVTVALGTLVTDSAPPLV